MEKQWRKFRDDFSNYLKYYIFEGESIIELTKNAKMAEETYLKRENELALQKQRLFRVKDFKQWQLLPEDLKDFDESSLAHNKKLAFPKMLLRHHGIISFRKRARSPTCS